MLNKGIFKKTGNALEAVGIVPLPKRQPSQGLEKMFVCCGGCKKMVLEEELKDKMMVCPKCGKHMHLSGRARILSIADADSFEETDAGVTSTDFLDFPGYEKKLNSSTNQSKESEAVITGRMKLGGIKCAVFAMDHRFMMGSMGSVVGEKITRCFEMADKEKIPVIGFTVSGGARMQEGLTSLMQMAKVSGAVKRFSDNGGLYICVLTDPTSGGVTASFAMEADILISEPEALVAFAGPRVIEQTIHKKLPPGFQRAEFLLERGFLDMVVPRKKHKSTLYKLICLHRKGD